MTRSLTGYQTRALETAVGLATEGLTYCTLGLAGEIGEVVERVKKAMRSRDTTTGITLTDAEAWLIALELGDVLWYLAVLASQIGYPLDEIADMNLKKLATRKSKGTIKESPSAGE